MPMTPVIGILFLAFYLWQCCIGKRLEKYKYYLKLYNSNKKQLWYNIVSEG